MKLLDNHFCFYCGAPSDTQDHVIPYSRLTIQKRKGGGKFTVGTTVPACRECNSLLGNKLFPDIMERCKYVNNKIKRRYRVAIDTSTSWSIDELNSMEGKIKTLIEQNITLGEVAYERVLWLNLPKFYKNLEEAQDEVIYHFPNNDLWRGFWLIT